MLADYLKTEKPSQPWQAKSRIKGYHLFVVVFILICISYIADIYLLTSHDEHNGNQNVLILQQSNQHESDTYYNIDVGEEDDPCHFTLPVTNKIYIYDLPYFYREQPRKHWYRWIHGKKEPYDDPKGLNFAFWKVMNLSGSNNDYYHTHMHSLEILFNERFKSPASSKYFTKNASEASLFHIPFPFAMHFRFYNVRDWDLLISHHQFVLDWLSDTVTNKTKIKDINVQQRESAVFKKYFLSKNYKPHWLSYTRIAHETSRLTHKNSPFWMDQNLNSDINGLIDLISPFWSVSIDRNCGEPPQCLKRISVPHPSVFHPKDKESLKLHIDKLKNINKLNKRDIFITFCGAIRTETRKAAHNTCKNQFGNRWDIWWNKYYKTQSDDDDDTRKKMEICHFEDSLEYEKLLKEKYNINNAAGRKIRTEIDFSKKCMQLYERSMFCIQEGADSTTRKGLWDGIIAGCIPIFLNGVMDTAEFECFVGKNYPWYLVLRKENYIQKLMSLPQEYIKRLQRNIMRMIPKIIYTNGQAGFNDAFDVLMHCLLRKTSFENNIDNPKCTIHKMVQGETKYDLERIMGYDNLYQYLEI